jgi:hypothetical protein
MVQGSVINLAGHSLASDALKIIIELLCAHFIHVLVCVGRAHAPANAQARRGRIQQLCYVVMLLFIT